VRKIHDESVAQRAAGQSGAAAAWGDGNARCECRLDYICGFLAGLGKSHGRRDELIVRGIRGVKLARAVVERYLTVRCVECGPLLRGKHVHKLAAGRAVDNGINAAPVRHGKFFTDRINRVMLAAL
jgi:hypothetical protein